MTNAYASMHGRSLASTLDAGVAGTVDRLALRGRSTGPTGRRWPSFGTCRPAPCATWISTAVTWRDRPPRGLRPLTRTSGATTAPPPRRTEPERTHHGTRLNLNDYADYAEQPPLRPPAPELRGPPRYPATYYELNALSDRELADIGLSRLNVRTSPARPSTATDPGSGRNRRRQRGDLALSRDRSGLPPLRQAVLFRRAGRHCPRT